ncbi:MAG: hypothetical protein ABMB14_27315, partial [Myxococcota bacterium]
AKGDEGDRGEVGPQGPQGSAGLRGLAGPTGLRGPYGARGVDGVNGQVRFKGDVYLRTNVLSVGAPTDVVVTCDDIDDILLTGGCVADGPIGEFELIESYPSGNGLLQFASWTCRAEEIAGGVAPFRARAFCIDVP